jgi:hypothetical protein
MNLTLEIDQADNSSAAAEDSRLLFLQNQTAVMADDFLKLKYQVTTSLTLTLTLTSGYLH